MLEVLKGLHKLFTRMTPIIWAEYEEVIPTEYYFIGVRAGCPVGEVKIPFKLHGVDRITGGAVIGGTGDQCYASPMRQTITVPEKITIEGKEYTFNLWRDQETGNVIGTSRSIDVIADKYGAEHCPL